MRTIKFRAKDSYGNWIYGYYFRLLTVEGKLTHKISTIDTNIRSGKNTVSLIAPETLGQYTGFKDCDGKEIYDGDILRYKMEGYPPGDYEVFFYDIFGGWWVRHKCNLCKDDLQLYKFIEEKGHIIKIIGNIHEKVKE